MQIFLHRQNPAQILILKAPESGEAIADNNQPTDFLCAKWGFPFKIFFLISRQKQKNSQELHFKHLFFSFFSGFFVSLSLHVRSEWSSFRDLNKKLSSTCSSTNSWQGYKNITYWLYVFPLHFETSLCNEIFQHSNSTYNQLQFEQKYSNVSWWSSGSEWCFIAVISTINSNISSWNG